MMIILLKDNLKKVFLSINWKNSAIYFRKILNLKKI